MTRSLTHVLLTRFNLPSRGHESLVRAREGWLRDRVALFERYCLPSVQAQTQRDFSWLVYLDPQSPAWLLDRMARYEAAGHLTPCLREEVPRADLLADLRALTDAGDDPPGDLLTTNLDNDDGVARDFVARLQAAARSEFPGPDPVALYLADGLVVRGDELYARVDPHNAFCSVRAGWDRMTTCWADWHIGLADHMPAVVLRGAPAWLQVVHGANVSNRVRGHRTVPPRHAAAFPGLLDGLPSPTPAALVRDRLLAGPARGLREAGRATAKTTITGLLGRDALDRAKSLKAGAGRWRPPVKSSRRAATR